MLVLLRLVAWLLPLLWAHREARVPRPERVGRMLNAFLVALLALDALTLVVRVTKAPASGPLLAPLLFLAGLAVWVPVAWLSAYGTRGRDYWLRGPLLFVALILWATNTWTVATGFTLAAVLAHRWTAAFETRRVFAIALAGTVFFVVQLLVGPVRLEKELPLPALHPLAAFGSACSTIAFGVLIAGTVSAVVRFVRDPSLGIRTVGRRLALSHVLVVVVPLLLMAALWAFTTILGVSNERALVAARFVVSESRALRASLEAALSEGASDARLRALAEAQRERWPGMLIWTVKAGRVEALHADTLGRRGEVAQWIAQRDSVAHDALVGLGGRRFLGALARGADGAFAVAFVPADTFLARVVSPVARAHIAFAGSTTLRADSARTSTATEFDEDAEDEADSALAAVDAALDSAAAIAGGRDSVELEAARRITRRLGIPDSVVTADERGRGRRNRPRISITTDGKRRQVSSDDDPYFLLNGHATIEGLAFRRGRWVPRDAVVDSHVPIGELLGGLLDTARENRLSVLPIVLLSLTLVLALFVLLFDVVMVTNMARSITSAIQALKVGARRLEGGTFDHRIEVAGRDDLWDVAATFNQAVAGLERAQGLEKEKHRLESELSLARQIQARLLPAAPPAIAGLEIAGLSESAREVGGDYFDHIDLGDERVLLVVADVSGKGVPAALLMSGFRASLVSQDLSASAPSSVAERLNEFLLRSVQPGKFVTAFIGFLDGKTGQLVYANAGHNPPVIVRTNGEHEWLTTGGLILGILPGSHFDHGEAVIEPGDFVALYTDGVTEGQNASGELWGEERLLNALRVGRDLPCATLAERIAAEVRTFEGTQGPADDITLVIARRRAGAAD